MEKLYFILTNYFLLSIFLLSCYGFGSQLINYTIIAYFKKNDCKNNQPLFSDTVFNVCLSISLGMGIFIIFFQLLGIIGVINNINTILITFFGLLLFFINILILLKEEFIPSTRHDNIQLLKRIDLKKSILQWSILFICIALFLIPSLNPPHAYDEIMYHLPHAKQWAENGFLSINKWLRYPYFPYNFDLLFAACLTLKQELLTHLIHTSAALLTIVSVYRVSLLHFNRIVACLSSLFLYFSFKGYYHTAYIDYGLTLFVFLGLYNAFEGYVKNNVNYFYLGAFFIGLSIGTKYQALIYVIPFVWIVLLKERNLINLFKISLCLILPFVYWYLRNYILTGNPIEPLGGSIFGYYSWNKQDMVVQLNDLRFNAADWPKWLLWPACLSFLYIKNTKNKLFSYMVYLSLYSFIIWIFTSHYSRYLFPAYPFIAILSATSIYNTYSLFLNRIVKKGSFEGLRGFFTKEKNIWIFGVAVVMIVINQIYKTPNFLSKYLNNIDNREYASNQFLKERIKTYDVALFLKQHPKYKIVECAYENEKYYLPKNTIGGVFGEGRYTDFIGLPSKLLAQKIHNFQANSLLIPNSMQENLVSRKDFNKYFYLVMAGKNSQLYGLKNLQT